MNASRPSGAETRPRPPIRIEALGHVTLYVRDVEASARFYRDVLGLIDRGRAKGGRLAFFSAGHRHHDVACQAVTPGAPAPRPGAPGLYHIAFKIGTTLEDLETAHRSLVAQGLPVFGDWLSGPIRSISTRDPDGHEIELYVETPDREEPPNHSSPLTRSRQGAADPRHAPGDAGPRA